ncbi:MAG: methyltransferase [Deltaproteobacteria bacterium]|nr:methyltransferase [Deltaproteobacteria bacterium]
MVKHGRIEFKARNEKLASKTLFEMVKSYWVSQSVYIAAKLGIADLLKAGPKNIDDLADATGTHRRSLYRLMRALASVGVFAEEKNGRFRLTPVGECLQSGVPDSMRAMAIMHGEQHYEAWGNLLYSVKTGETAFKHVFGEEFFQFLAQNPEAAKTFDESMTNRSSMVNAAVVGAYDFPKASKIVDVGGGRGGLVVSILKANPSIRGILFDLPRVVQGAESFIKAEGVADRCELIAGDFFDAVPSGADLYILSGILHDWDDDRAVKILKNCDRAMPHHGKILVIAMVIPEDNEPFYGKFHDLQMMVVTGGRDRTEKEYRELFASGGLKLTNIFSTPSSVSLIEGV